MTGAEIVRQLIGSYADKWKVNKPTQAALLHDILGNPWAPGVDLCGRRFFPLGFCTYCCKVRSWNNGTVPKIAADIYERRAFAETPVLADALEEAGCADQTILRHLRGEERCPGFLLDESGIECRSRIASPCCDGTGWCKRPVACVRGCHVLDALLGKS